ncbi:hypothetical protein [Hyphomicrobium sp.]|uniref:hypothetical protein n=1 Tax=Hyphomicrobium sp. TaxID=82 RepID=UPI003F6FB7FA
MAARNTLMKVSVPAVTAFAALVLMVPAMVAPAEAKPASCVTKHGSATGITRDFAEYEAFLIIRQVTGNWPFETDTFSKPVYKCSSDGALWTCRASAQVCKS